MAVDEATEADADESVTRALGQVDALAQGLGDREAAVTREITKAFEECATGTLSSLANRYRDAPPKGEIVIVVGPPVADDTPPEDDALDAMLAEALTRLPASKAAGEIAKATGADRRMLYGRAMAMKPGA